MTRTLCQLASSGSLTAGPRESTDRAMITVAPADSAGKSNWSSWALQSWTSAFAVTSTTGGAPSSGSKPASILSRCTSSGVSVSAFMVIER